jgi:hypothetical protein
MNIQERAKAPTPKFFKILRTIGLFLLDLSGSILATPIAFPGALITATRYIVVAVGILSKVSQITVEDSKKKSTKSSDKINQGL